VLAAAGVLRGVRVTTHWLTTDEITEFGAEPVAQRLVQDGKVITAMGGLGAFELGLLVARDVAGEDVAEGIRMSIGVDPEAFDPRKAARLNLVVRRWYHEAEPTPEVPSRWHRLVDRLRHGSLVVVRDDATPAAGTSPPRPKGWRRTSESSNGSAVDE
jgi:hypothetical protein